MTAIIDYKAGNLTSVKLAFAALGVETVVTSDPKVIASADRVVFPGVGAAKSAMENLRSLGLVEPVKEAAAPRSADAPAREPAVNQDVVEELEKHADDFGASPLARGYGSAFSAMGSSVPILEVREEEGGENEAGVRHDQRNDTAGL